MCHIHWCITGRDLAAHHPLGVNTPPQQHQVRARESCWCRGGDVANATLLHAEHIMCSI
jgi:hypothetical protein